jgi:hypothetical protein
MSAPPVRRHTLNTALALFGEAAVLVDDGKTATMAKAIAHLEKSAIGTSGAPELSQKRVSFE